MKKNASNDAPSDPRAEAERGSGRGRASAVFLLGALLLLASCGKKPEKQGTADSTGSDIYSLELTKDRKEKDLYFLSNASTPLKPEDQEKFNGLAYYPPTKEFVFWCGLDRDATAKERLIETSKGKPRRMVDIGSVRFAYKGNSYRLRVYVPADTSREGMYYFIPFADATNGKETYGGGRFLDFERIDNDSLFLDFNYAYSPYCAYNDRYDCPIPPAENRLPIPIRAGEKQFPLHPH